MRISDSTVQNILDTADIVDVVSDYVTLKRRGQNMLACCPFHDEKTPSFTVSPAKGIYKCFGCGKGGDSVGFVMEIEGLGYVEALKQLASKYAITVEQEELPPDEVHKQNERDSLYIVLNYAKETFIHNLWQTEDGKNIGLSYLQERGIDKQNIKKFELGYTFPEWDSFYKKAKADGHSEELLEKAGLIIRKEPDKIFDRFRGRVIFPIQSVSGKTIAFGARTLKKDDQPKYLNSPETDVYHKSKILYGIYQAKQAIRQKENCYLVEGYTDVIGLHMAGIENVVASSGTSLTEDQIRLIGRFSENITVLFDGDEAGIKASLRGIDMILEGGLNVKAVVFPEGEDPDSYFRQVGSTAFQEYLQTQPIDFITFKVNLFKEEAERDPIRKSEVIREIVQSIAKIPDPIKRSVYLQQCSTLLSIDESVLITQMNKVLLSQKKEKQKRQIEEESGEEVTQDAGLEEKEEKIYNQDSLAQQERESIRLLLNYGLNQLENESSICQHLLEELHEIEFSTPAYVEIINIFKEHLQKNIIVDAEFLKRQGSEKIRNLVVDLISDQHEISPLWEDKYHIYVPKEKDKLANLVYENVLRLKQRYLRKMISENREILKNAKEVEEELLYLKVIQELKNTEKGIAKELGNVIMY